MKTNSIFLITIILAFLALQSCQSNNTPLPYLGMNEMVNGKEVPHTIDPFVLVNQYGDTITNETLSENIYLADYFFTSCPSICPIVKKQMLRLYKRYENNNLVKLVSISMDTKRDSVPVLKEYAKKLGVHDNRWWFLTGEKDLIFSLNQEFFIAALEAPDVPGGFDHSGKIVLVDKKGRVRAFAEGTDKEDVTELFGDIDKLIEEVEANENPKS